MLAFGLGAGFFAGALAFSAAGFLAGLAATFFSAVAGFLTGLAAAGLGAAAAGFLSLTGPDGPMKILALNLKIGGGRFGWSANFMPADHQKPIATARSKKKKLHLPFGRSKTPPSSPAASARLM